MYKTKGLKIGMQRRTKHAVEPNHTNKSQEKEII